MDFEKTTTQGKSLAESQANVAEFYQYLSRVMVAVEQRMIEQSFTAIGDSTVFLDASAALERGSRWLPRYLTRAYVKGKKPTRAMGYCIHLGPYTEPTSLSFLEKSNLVLPFVSLACLQNMLPGPLEVEPRQIWDRLWDSGWWATYEDHVSGPLRSYTTTREVSGFQATITGALLNFIPFEPIGTALDRIVGPLLLLHENANDLLQRSPYLMKKE
jgi:hypothetical protein